tara:strand:+ start:408 stop:551 length:144 start_codon:yes stop_codon:yes gene_type:complete
MNEASRPDWLKQNEEPRVNRRKKKNGVFHGEVKKKQKRITGPNKMKN